VTQHGHLVAYDFIMTHVAMLYSFLAILCAKCELSINKVHHTPNALCALCSIIVIDTCIQHIVLRKQVAVMVSYCFKDYVFDSQHITIVNNINNNSSTHQAKSKRASCCFGDLYDNMTCDMLSRRRHRCGCGVAG
jgi:hypothetical protein